MKGEKRLVVVVSLVLVVLLLVGCGAAEPAPIAVAPTVTPVPPTSTPTSLPPTAAPSPVPPTAAPTPAFTFATSVKDIVGTWHSRPKDLYLRFYEDGNAHQSHSLDRLDANPYASSEIWFEGTQMYLKEKAVSGVPSCGAEPAIYQVRLYLDGTIQVLKIEDKCPPRAGDTALQFEPVP